MTEGIQKGHLPLQLTSLARGVGARENEVSKLVAALEKAGVRDSVSAREFLAQLRRKED